MLDEEPSARPAFVDRACGGDPDMRREIEALLAEEDEPGLIDRPVWSAASDLMEPAPALAPGTALGPYQIIRFMGEGGMGQIFRAVDVRLNRTVAVKVLPSFGLRSICFVRKRFGREAQERARRSLTRTSARYTTSAPAMASTSSSWYTSRETPSRHASRR